MNSCRTANPAPCHSCWSATPNSRPTGACFETALQAYIFQQPPRHGQCRSGIVTIKEFSDSPSTTFCVLVDDTRADKAMTFHQTSHHIIIGYQVTDSGTYVIRLWTSVAQVQKTLYAHYHECLGLRSRSMRNVSQLTSRLMKLMPMMMSCTRQVYKHVIQNFCCNLDTPFSQMYCL